MPVSGEMRLSSFCRKRR